MAAQQGFQYERNVANFLRKSGLVDKNFQPAGSGSDRADLEIVFKKKTINVELKITAASGGSLVLKWDPRKKKWGFGDVSGDPEKSFLADLATSSGALKKINKEWSSVPLKRDFLNAAEKAQVERIPKASRYKIDAANFQEIGGELPGSSVSDYYAMRDTYYVNIGTSGFYTFGTKDPNSLNENCTKKGLPAIPSFAKSANVKYRARVQDKGGGNYQYTFELAFSIPKSKESPYNLGPCSGKGSVDILKSKANISCLL
jgi:hypothetical protein